VISAAAFTIALLGVLLYKEKYNVDWNGMQDRMVLNNSETLLTLDIYVFITHGSRTKVPRQKAPSSPNNEKYRLMFYFCHMYFFF
jgi:hypothetical protein